jgi:hypothetical protein
MSILLLLQIIIFSLYIHIYVAFQSSNQFTSNTFFKSVQSKINQVQRKANRTGLFLSSQMIELSDIEDVLANAPIPRAQRVFLINGWRWHTISVKRDLQRFAKLSKHLQYELKNGSSLSSSQRQRLSGSHAFVYKFNWSALMQVERSVFFPWLRRILPSSMHIYVDRIASIHDEVMGLGQCLEKECNLFDAQNIANIPDQLYTLREVDRLLEQMGQCAHKIQQIQVSVIVKYSTYNTITHF